MGETSVRTVTRFAPSPTGSLHIGGAHTALFNYLWAKRGGGVFILRFEDTDRARSSIIYEESILRDLTWLGIAPDQVAARQSERGSRYAEVLAGLAALGAAYPCFCSHSGAGEGRVEEARDPCRGLPHDERRGRMSAGEAHCWRFAVPEGDVFFTFRDRLRGDMTLRTDSIADFVLARGDGSHTYLFAVVVDDHDSGVSHVIRGEEHLSNAPKQELIYRALGWSAPEWVHIPMILDNERHKLSKRGGAISIGSYRDAGWLPGALISYLATLSWSRAPADRISTPLALARAFDVDAVALVTPVHDEERMRHFGRLSVADVPLEDLFGCLGVLTQNTGTASGPSPDMLLLIGEMRPACATIDDLKASVALSLAAPEGGGAFPGADPEWIGDLAKRLYDIPREDWESESIKNCMRSFQKEREIKGRDFYHALRLKITGRGEGPPLALIMSCLGRTATMERISGAPPDASLLPN
ncbi:MAG: glutamate--tRNA ligase [Synergistaceae bacterium]|nr:glutamate--tRNA ligase [Synergistaceae bacterium]